MMIYFLKIYYDDDKNCDDDGNDNEEYLILKTPEIFRLRCEIIFDFGHYPLRNYLCPHHPF